ncbi:MAG: GntR family transcriptional regulator [Solirubrobacterales bacterium]|nr:GntR family transcriptional regulator [Solirubrobacterales bacterium]
MSRRNNGSARARPSLVDSAEQALRNWLAPGRYRTGDRLPPEHDVAEMLGISRGTLRTALQRLEDTGEIVRRQGSGTFVGRVAVPTQLDERLERLEPYSSLAKRRGVSLAARRLRVEQRAVGPEVGELLQLEPSTVVTTVFRVLVASGTPAAVMFDVVHPAIELPETRALTRKLESGKMVLDVLIELDVPVGFARTRVMPCLVTPREQVGKALGIQRTTAALELEEVIHAGSGDPVAYSRDLFAPGALDVHVMRSLEAFSPVPIAGAGNSGRRSRTERQTGARAATVRR